MKVVPERLNPNGFWLLHYMGDITKRFIILYGGSSSAKSYSVAQCVLIATLADNQNSIVMRKVGASIQKSIYEDFKVAAEGLGISSHFTFVMNSIKCANGARIDFSGLDDPEKIKGISNYKRICLEEWSEFDEQDFKQLRKRLRGKAGQQIICTFNPIKETHWIKRNFIDVEKWHDVPMRLVNTSTGKRIKKELTEVKSLRENEPKDVLNVRTGEIEKKPSDAVLIQSTYLNNFWVVGSPDGKYGFYDEQCVADFEHDRIYDPDYYNVYALGEWGVLRTGSEYLGSFNRGMHCKDVEYDSAYPIHISVDNNVLPYITCSVWQFVDNQVRELFDIPCENPNNTARKAGSLVRKRLEETIGNECPKVIVHGDASARASNTIDEQNRSFLDLFLDSVKSDLYGIDDNVGTSNPSVPMGGEFINAIFDGAIDGLSIVIDPKCNTSIEDYLAVQKDANGAILKTKVKNKMTGQSYEEHGHFTDTFRYMVCDVWREEFLSFSNRRKRNIYAKDGALRMFNPSVEYEYTDFISYLMPNVGGKVSFLEVARNGDSVHVIAASQFESTSTEEIRTLLGIRGKVCVVECDESYFPFVRSLRNDFSGIDFRAKKSESDYDRRISATSDYVKEHVYFDDGKISDDQMYAAFVNSLMDYRRDSDDKSASAALSGVVLQIMKRWK